MDSRGIIIKIISLLISLPISAFLLSLHFFPHSTTVTSPLSVSAPLHSHIDKACSHTLYSSLCRSTLSTIPASHNILHFAINRTAAHVSAARLTIADHFAHQRLNAHEKNAFQDCMELLDQTLYELNSAMDELGSPPSPGPRLHRSYGNIKTLLSAAMTNDFTCINGFLDFRRKRRRNSQRLQKLLTPISRMISNTLALIKNVEKANEKKIAKRRGDEEVAHYLEILARRQKNLRHDVIVASDGSGDYDSITAAIAAAPNMSKKTYTIRIKQGVYKENVMIPREKINMMLVGDGMNSTIITGSRSFVDGFSTFESATLTVVGDKFMARDLTIENSAAPEKHQAVAVTVTSNAAFYRCGIRSHQDTLYAHSLRQLYHECTIQGTIDFIFGNAAAVFQNCTILVRRPIRGQRNTITAQGREDPYQNTGISLLNCTIRAAVEFNPTQSATYLGRPWRNYSRVIVANSYLGELIHPRGWLEWDKYSRVDTVDYIECMNSGPGAATRRRISWAGYRKNCGQETVKQFTVEEFLHGADDWVESTVMPILGGS